MDNTTVQKNMVWQEGDTLKYLIVAPVDENEATRLSKEGAEKLDTGDVRFVTIDLQQSTNDFSSNARKIWVEFLKHERIEKTAIFGGNVFVRTLAAFIISAAGKEDIRFFKTKEEADAWLQVG